MIRLTANIRHSGQIRRTPCYARPGYLDLRRTRSAILTGRFNSTLLRAAMPVRHDIAPARESGNRMCEGTSGFAKNQFLKTVVSATVSTLELHHRNLFTFCRAPRQTLPVSTSTCHGWRSESRISKTALLSIERGTVTLKRHERIQRVVHVRSRLILNDRGHRVVDINVLTKYAAVAMISIRVFGPT